MVGYYISLFLWTTISTKISTPRIKILLQYFSFYFGVGWEQYNNIEDVKYRIAHLVYNTIDNHGCFKILKYSRLEEEHDGCHQWSRNCLLFQFLVEFVFLNLYIFVFCVAFCGSLFVILSFCSFSFGIVLSVLLRFTASDYPFGSTCQWLAIGWWFSPCTPVSSTNKTDSHDITEIALKLALNTIIHNPLVSSNIP